MTGTRVVLITAAGPGGQVDIGVRSDATPKDLVSSLGSVIGVVQGSSVVEHHAPPRPGVPQGRRTQLTSNASLGDSGVADGDMIIFRKSASEERAVGPGQRPGATPAAAGRPGPGQQAGSGHWSWSASADGDPDDAGQWTWSESAEVSQPAPVRGERPGAEKIYRPAHADVTRPARREPGAHRADGPGGEQPGGEQRPESEQWHQLGSTRGTDSDEPDDRP